MTRKTLGLLVVVNLTQRLRDENIFGGKQNKDYRVAKKVSFPYMLFVDFRNCFFITFFEWLKRVENTMIKRLSAKEKLLLNKVKSPTSTNLNTLIYFLYNTNLLNYPS